MKKIYFYLLSMLLIISVSSSAQSSNNLERLYQQALDYSNGENGKRQDFEQALSLFAQAAEQGHVEAQLYMAVFFQMKEQYTQAMLWYRKAANAGNATAQFAIGNMYELGDCGLTQDMNQALYWYRKSAEQGFASAQYSMAVHYINNEKNYAEGAIWLRKAAEQGHDKAQFHLGAFYENGLGVEKNLEEAKRWYQKSAEQGKEDAVKRVKPKPTNAFSVSENKQVVFSKSNLQYHPTNKKWRFAPNQFSYIGSANSNVFDKNPYTDDVSSNTYGLNQLGYVGMTNTNYNTTASYNGWIDLFGWGTGANPTNIYIDNWQYKDFVDWGANKIGNDAPYTWRTLTHAEWDYLIYERTNAKSLRGIAKVNGYSGLILLPDNWSCPNGLTFKPGGYESDRPKLKHYAAHQTFTADQWLLLEKTGAVFLPAAGYYEFEMHYGCGRYWSATNTDTQAAYYLCFDSTGSWIDIGSPFKKYSVRLVKDI